MSKIKDVPSLSINDILVPNFTSLPDLSATREKHMINQLEESNSKLEQLRTELTDLKSVLKQNEKKVKFLEIFNSVLGIVVSILAIIEFSKYLS